MMHLLLMRLKLGQSFDALAGDVEIKLELETMTTLQDDHKWSAPPKRFYQDGYFQKPTTEQFYRIIIVA